MTLATLFASLLSWIVGFVLFVPFTLLRLVGLLFPSCSSFGMTSIPLAAEVSAVQLIRVGWPMLQWLPWEFIWNYVSAWLLLWFVLWVWKMLPKLMSFGLTFWMIVVAVYVVLTGVSFFLGWVWQDSPVFSEVFGTSPSSTNGFSGGGGGGGGGGGW